MIALARNLLSSSSALPLASALALGACAGSDPAAMYVMTLGTDTVGAEQVWVGRNTIEGRQIRSWPVASDISYRAELGADGQVIEYSVESQRVGSEPAPVSRTVIEVDGKSVLLQVWHDGAADSTWLEAEAEPIPVLYPSALSHLLVTRSLERAGGEAAEVDLVGGPFNPPMRAIVTRMDAGSIRVSWPAWGDWHYILRQDGDVLESVDAERTTERYTIVRVDDLDLDGLWTRFAERQREIGGPRQLSPLDTVQARLAGAAIAVEYSRPLRRGRTIFGGLEPWGKVWRTGAGYTTHFVTDKKLSIGGHPLAPGKYSLWTLPTLDGVTLIVNRQTDTWSVAYDSALDVFRVPMARKIAEDPIDQFTISLKPSEGALVLGMEWERERWSVDVRR